MKAGGFYRQHGCIPIAHCTLAPYASAGVALRSNADESMGGYGAFDKKSSSIIKSRKIFYQLS
jgi:hypothetical protein